MVKELALAWYWDITIASNDALAKYEFEYYDGLEEWRKAMKEQIGL